MTWKWQTFQRSIYQRNSLRIPKIDKIKKSPVRFNSIQFWNKKIYTYHQRHTGWLIFTFMIIIKKLKFLVNKLFFFSSNHYYCWHYIYMCIKFFFSFLVFVLKKLYIIFNIFPEYKYTRNVKQRRSITFHSTIAKDFVNKK